jgi:uncharacterized protein YukJ
MYKRRKPKGAERTYGVLVGQLIDGKLKPTGNSPHYELWVKANSSYRVAVNVRSQDGSQVLIYYARNYQSPAGLALHTLAAGPLGFTPLVTGADGKGLDYLRDGLFPTAAMVAIPDTGDTGVTLHNLLDAQVKRAKVGGEARVIVFGEFFHDKGRDETFGFSPEQGVHDVHMMQGNRGSFADDNRVHGDGALFIHFRDGETAALFIRFATQQIPTDDRTGAPKNA